MIERIRSLLRVWRQLNDREQEAVSEALLTEIQRIIEEGNDDRQTLHNLDSTDGDEQRDPGTHGADGYLGLVNDTGSDPVRCGKGANITTGSDG